MEYNDYKYVIVPTTEIDGIDFTKVHSIRELLRYSVDGSNFIVRYEGNKPYCLYGKTAYTHQQILEITKDENGDWYSSTEP